MIERFPIMGDSANYRVRGYVPMDFMLQFEERAKKNHSQSIRRLAERGGLTAQEAMAVVNDTPYRDRRWRNDDAAWANLQLIVGSEYPDWDFGKTDR